MKKKNNRYLTGHRFDGGTYLNPNNYSLGNYSFGSSGIGGSSMNTLNFQNNGLNYPNYQNNPNLNNYSFGSKGS
jgi:hypothetical protein